MDAMFSSVERERSVSSMRRMNAPPLWRAKSQLKSAVRAPPTCRWPVGLGAKRTRTGDVIPVRPSQYVANRRPHGVAANARIRARPTVGYQRRSW